MADPVTLAVTAAINIASMAMTASQKIEGPRLDSVDVTNADYGAPLFNFYGTRKNEGPSVIFAEPLREEKHQNKTKGGKYNDYKYFGTWAVMVADHSIDAVLKVTFDEHVVFDLTNAGPIMPGMTFAQAAAIFIRPKLGLSLGQNVRIYLGGPAQMPDPRMLATIEARNGAGSCPAYRGVSYIMFEEIPLEKFGNRMPQVKITATHNGTPTFPYDTRTVQVHSPASGVTFSPDYSRLLWVWGNDYEIWDVAARAPIVSGTFDGGLSPVAGSLILGIGLDGRIYTRGGGFGEDIIAFPADGVGGGSLIFDSGIGLNFVRVLAYGITGQELVCAVPFPSLGWDHNLVYANTVIPTNSVTTTDWAVQDYLQDTHGDVWALGTTASTICLYCLTNENGRIGNFIEVAAPSSFGSPPVCSAFHYSNSVVDHFVVAWAEADFVTIDINSGLVTNTRTGVGTAPGYPNAFQNTRPGAATFWAGGSLSAVEYSSVDLSTVRTVSMISWSGYLGNIIYDPINNALVGSPNSGIFTEVAWFYLDRQSGGGQTLQSIVEDVAFRVGLDPVNDIDATALDQIVLGYSWAQGSGKAIIEPLLEFYNSEARPHDFELQFIKRGGSGSGAILTSEMGASADGNAPRYVIERTLDTDLPRRVTVSFADPAIDQQPNSVPAQRDASATDSARELSLDLSTLAVAAVDARSAADSYLRRTWYGAESYTNAVTRGFSALEPGDLKSLDFDGISKSAKLTQITFQADGVLALKWTRDMGTVHVAPTQPGVPATGIIPPVIPVFGYTKGFVLDTPLTADADDGIITYLAAAPYTTGTAWPGSTFYQSTDAGLSYSTEYANIASDHVATWGTTSGALADASPAVFDRGNTLTVVIQEGTLTSTTEAAVLNGANRALIGDEQVGFTTATLTAPLTYQLSGFLRGRRGTEWATGTHVAGDRFVMLNAAIARHVHGASDVGTTLYIEPVTAGSLSIVGFPQTLAYVGRSAMPYAPSHLEVEDVAGDKVVGWIRRTRIGGDWRDFNDAALGEGSEAYEADILDAGGGVLRTYSGLSSPTLTYDAADQASDGGLGVSLAAYQISTTVGRGFPATVAL